LFVVVGVEFMVAVTAPFYCQLCCSFSSSASEAQCHLLSVNHNDKYKVRLLLADKVRFKMLPKQSLAFLECNKLLVLVSE